MRKEECIENILKILISYTYNYIGMADITNVHISILYVLYGIHKKYNIADNDEDYLFLCDDDNFLKELHDYKKDNRGSIVYPYLSLYNQLKGFCSEIEAYYPEVINRLNEKYSEFFGHKEYSKYIPGEISALFSYYINKLGCKNIFDPFCGTSNIVHYIKTPFFYRGAEADYGLSLISKVNVESRHGSDRYIWNGQSNREWLKYPFDAVCSCPGYGFYSTNPLGVLKAAGEMTYEELLYNNAISHNNARLILSIESIIFSFQDRNLEKTRKDLVEKNLLDTVILLPSNLLYGVDMPSLLVVCKNGREKDEPITFIYADDFYVNENKPYHRFDIDKFVRIADSKNSKYCVKVNKKQIREFNYNLNPCLYRHGELKSSKNQKVYRLEDLITEVEIERESDKIAPCHYISSELTRNDFFQIITKMNETSIQDVNQFLSSHPHYTPEQGKSYFIVYEENSTIKYYLYTEQDPFYCSDGLKVFSIDNNIVNPKYLVHLLSSPAITNSHMDFMSFMRYPFIIDSLDNQEKIVDSIILDYHTEKERKEAKQTISDLEHMLGSTQIKINNIISRLERMTSEGENCSGTVKQLKDNIEYMNRIIHYNNSSIEKSSFDIKSYSISDLVNDYLQSWNNYGGNYFNIGFINNLDREVTVDVDRTLFTVMLDAILSNAIRHGFKKNRHHTPDNQVVISIKEEKYNECAYVVLRIANNGDPMDDDYTIQDYVTKGRYSSSTGRSGLGGYHVYQIVKGHHGYLYLDSNKDWNTIVEILIPSIDNNELDNLNNYKHECI